MLLQQLQLSEPGTEQVMAVGSAARDGQESVGGSGEGVKSSEIQNAKFEMRGHGWAWDSLKSESVLVSC